MIQSAIVILFFAALVYLVVDAENVEKWSETAFTAQKKPAALGDTASGKMNPSERLNLDCYSNKTSPSCQEGRNENDQLSVWGHDQRRP